MQHSAISFENDPMQTFVESMMTFALVAEQHGRDLIQPHCRGEWIPIWNKCSRMMQRLEQACVEMDQQAPVAMPTKATRRQLVKRPSIMSVQDNGLDFSNVAEEDSEEELNFYFEDDDCSQLSIEHQVDAAPIVGMPSVNSFQMDDSVDINSHQHHQEDHYHHHRHIITGDGSDDGMYSQQVAQLCAPSPRLKVHQAGMRNSNVRKVKSEPSKAKINNWLQRVQPNSEYRQPSIVGSACTEDFPTPGWFTVNDAGVVVPEPTPKTNARKLKRVHKNIVSRIKQNDYSDDE